ncbi:MAG: hypothetical protein ACJ0TD_03985 [Arenicellales bacterium]
MENLQSIVNVGTYPIHDLDHPAAEQAIVQAKAQLALTGACHFPEFLSSEGLAGFLQEAQSLESKAHPSNNWYTPYYGKPDDAYPAGHPFNSTVHFAVRYVSRTLLPESSPLRQLFEADDLLAFLRALLPNERLHRYSDARGSLNYTVMTEDDELGWHFDACELVASILLRPAEAGGTFEYIPGVRTVDDECFADVASILSGQDQHRTPVNFLPGDMVLFRGRHSLHRVTSIKGEVSRLIALMSFDNVKKALERDVPDDLLPS